MTVCDAFVLDDDISGNCLAWSDGKFGQSQGRIEPLQRGAVDHFAVLDGEDIDIEDAVLEELNYPRGLLVKAVDLWDDRIRTQPPMRSELAFLRTGVCQLQPLALHMAGLAGGNRILHVERQRRLFGEGGVLPLVVEEDSALPFVIVQSVWQSRLVAGRAKLRGAIEVPHDRFAVAVKVSEDLAVGDLAGDWLAVFVDQYSGHAHNVAAGAAGVDLLDGVADRAGDAILIIRTLLRRALCQGSGHDRDWVVTTLAVAGKFNSFGVIQQRHIFEVIRDAIGVGVSGLAPLLVTLLMTMTAVLCRRKSLGIDKRARICHRV